MRINGLKVRMWAATLVCIGLLAFYFSPQMQAVRMIPKVFYMQEGQTRRLPDINMMGVSVTGDSVEARMSSDETLTSKGILIASVEDGDSDVTVKVAGVPVRKVKVKVGKARNIMPGGKSIGVTMHTKGALVVGTSDVLSNDGTAANPAKDAGILAGDIIESINGVQIDNADHLSEVVNKQSGNVMIGVLRDGKHMSLLISPRADAQDGKLRLGLWVRDSTAGVGTMTFYDPLTKFYGALGHAVTDIDTRSRLALKNGEVIDSEVIDVKQGSKGEPGELKGNFTGKKPLGNIEKNTDYGIFGEMYETYINPYYPEGLPMALQEEVQLGEAQILTTIDGEGVKCFNCEVIKIQPQAVPSPRGMVIRVTDENLLQSTAGIVQGMSGSPIIQNGKIIGAVTHVFINDPAKGYGMFIEWMMREIE